MAIKDLVRTLGAFLRVKPTSEDPTVSELGTIQYSDGTSRPEGFYAFTANGWQPFTIGTGFSVGSYQFSALTVTQFQAINGTEWVLADGQDVTGSTYETITGNSNVPDRRGRAGRMKDHGAGVNADGDLSVNTLQNEQYLSHGHTFGLSDNGTGNDAAGGQFSGAITATEPTSFSGGNETRMDNITENVFIKID